jgi:hypothetical protein
MRPLTNILMAEAGAGSGGGASGTPPVLSLDLNSLPEDIRAEPSLANIKTIPDLAKGYVSAQKMVGADKLLKPQQNWKPEQWSGFYRELGRPENPDGYSFKPGENHPKEVPIDEARLKEAKKALYDAGLTDKQASGVLQYYLDTTVRQYQTATQAAETAKQQAMIELKNEWGANYDANINTAKAVVQKFAAGNQAFQDKIDEVGNDPAFIKLFAAIGKAMLDDTAPGQGPGLIVGDAANAQAEIGKRKMDPEFVKALSTKDHPGHAEAVQEWEALHQKAYPGKR